MKLIPIALQALLLAASPALAQHAGHGPHAGHRVHAGHGAHAGHAGTKSRSRPGRHAVRGHAGHGARNAAAATPATREYQAAHHTMMAAMNQPYTGDPDADFRIQMIPHHQGAIDMARVALRRASDPWTRQLAEAIIVEQQREIYDMQNWLARRGYRAPPGGQPRHIIDANSYRTLPEQPGTLEETQGTSWTPGSGVPRQR